MCWFRIYHKGYTHLNALFSVKTICCSIIFHWPCANHSCFSMVGWQVSPMFPCNNQEKCFFFVTQEFSQMFCVALWKQIIFWCSMNRETAKDKMLTQFILLLRFVCYTFNRIITWVCAVLPVLIRNYGQLWSVMISKISVYKEYVVCSLSLIFI